MTTMEQMRAWQGPAVFSYGFRIFFLSAAVWAFVAMAFWIAMLRDWIELSYGIDPVSWHAHEFLYGYLGAVMAGFLLTAVPNWTGRMPVAGWPLVALWTLWALGRFAFLFTQGLPPALIGLLDLSFFIGLAMVLLREIVAGRNWRNLIIMVLLAIFALGDALFLSDVFAGEPAHSGVGIRIGVAAALMMIAVVGGRIIPSFTRNWLVKRGRDSLPVPPMQRFDLLCLATLFAALLFWVALPDGSLTATALAVAGVLHAIRLSRWQGQQTLSEPLVWVLHFSYAFLPIGALAVALGNWLNDEFLSVAAQHIWMAGAIGGMTTAVMSRAILGHTGQPLTANNRVTLIYVGIFLSLVLRLVAGLAPESANTLYALSAAAWMLAFLTFVYALGPLVMRPRETPS